MRARFVTLLAVAIGLLVMTGTAAAATISGAVTNVAGKPIGGSKVDLLEYVGGIHETRASTTASPVDGSWSFTGLPAATYVIRFVGSSTFMREYYDDVAFNWEATRFTLAADEVVTDVDAVLDTWPRVKGTVVSEATGEPISGAKVTLRGCCDATQLTGPAGTYEIVVRESDVRVRDYLLWFTDPLGYGIGEWHLNKPTAGSADPIALRPGTVTRVDAALALGGRISGTVTGEDGTPLAGVAGAVYAQNGTKVDDLRTEAGGRYTTPALAAGNYFVSFGEPYPGRIVQEFYDDAGALASATPISVTTGTTTSGIDLALARKASLVGQAFVGTTPLQWFDVQLYTPGGTLVAQGGAAGLSNGRYAIHGIDPGSYRVRFDFGTAGGVQWYDVKATRGEADPVVLGPDEERRIDPNAASGGRISGTVTGPDGAPEAIARVSFFNADGEEAGETLTTRTGSYQIGGMPSGQYRVRFHPASGGAGLPEWYDDAATLEGATPVTVRTGETTAGVNARLTRGIQLVGRVVRSDGQPIRGVRVRIFDAGTSIASATTSADGRYAVVGLMPGSYQVQFAAPAYDEDDPSNPDRGFVESEFYENKQLRANADTLGLSAPSTTLDATLNATGTVRGTIRTADTNQPLTAAKVTFVREDGLRAGPFLTTWRGEYEAPSLRPGRWRIYFQSPYLAYASEYYEDEPSLATGDTVTVTARTVLGGVDAALARRTFASGAWALLP